MLTKPKNIYFLLYCLLIVFQSYSQSKWSSVNGLYGGSIVSMALDSSKNLYAATEYNSILKSTNNGEYWSLTNFPSNIMPVILWASSNKIFAGTHGNGIYQLIDGGQSWSYSGLDGKKVSSFSCDGNGNIYAGTADLEGLYRSTDGGGSWNFFGLSGYSVYGIAASFHGTILAAVQDSVVFRSTDNGVHWIRSVNPYYDYVDNGRVLTIDKSGNIYLGMSGGVWCSKDDGVSWSSLGVNMPDVNGIAFLDSIIFVCGIDGVKKGKMDTNLWMTVDSIAYGIRSNAIVADNNNGIFIGSRWIGVTRSIDGGYSWQRSNTNFRNSYISCLTIDGNNIYSGLLNDGVYFSHDDGENWEHIWNSKTIPCALLADDSILIVAPSGIYFGLYRSSDHGTNWNPTNISAGVFNCFTMSSDGLYYAGGSVGAISGVCSSTDKGITWEWILRDYGIWSLASTPSGTIYVGTMVNGILRSRDKGTSWVNVGLRFGTTRCIISDSHGIVYASPGDGYIYRSINDGQSWDSLEFNFNSPVSSLLLLNDSIIIAGSDGAGVFLSTNQGLSWSEINFGLPDDGLTLASTSSGSIFAGTGNNGMFRTTQKLLLSVKSYSSNPRRFVLENNYPNPFNPTTRIVFALPERSFVVVKVFDLIGREIATIVSEELSAGEYSRQWNAANVPSGVYFCRLQAGKFTETKKLLLVR